MNRRQFCTAAAGMLAACAQPHRTPQHATVFIIHGYGATIDNHWFAWLQAQLQQRGIAAVRVPRPMASPVGYWESAPLCAPAARRFW